MPLKKSRTRHPGRHRHPSYTTKTDATRGEARSSHLCTLLRSQGHPQPKPTAQQCTQMPRNGTERPFPPICVHSCVRRPGGEAHAVGAVTQPPTHTTPTRTHEAFYNFRLWYDTLIYLDQCPFPSYSSPFPNVSSDATPRHFARYCTPQRLSPDHDLTWPSASRSFARPSQRTRLCVSVGRGGSLGPDATRGHQLRGREAVRASS